MDYIQIVTWGENAIVFIFAVLAYISYLRDSLRWDPKLTFALIFFANLIVGLLSIIYSESIGLQAMTVIVLYLSWVVPLKTNIVNGSALATCFQQVLNMVSNVLLGIVSFISSLVSGGGAWYSISEGGTIPLAMMLVYQLAGVAVAYLIVLQFREDILGLKGVVKWLVFLMIVVLDGLLMLIRSFLGDLDAYHDQPGGIMFVIDIIVMIDLVIAFIILAIHIFRKRRKESKEIEAEIAKNYERYSAIEDIKQEYRQIRHDMKNVAKHESRAGNEQP